MKRVQLILVILVSAFIPALAQRIQTDTSDRSRIVHLKTALNHLTVIEVTEPVVQVAAGSPSFKIEWRDNKVFVQPTEADATTNLFIWTANQRLNYELEPAGTVTDMDFAVDQTPFHPEPVKPAHAKVPAPFSTPPLLLAGKPVRVLASKPRGKPVEVWISDVYERDGRLLVRYAVRNHSSDAYVVNRPAVYQLDGVRSGEEAVGVVTLQITSSTYPTVLRFDFPSLKQSGNEFGTNGQQHINAFLVR
jgi:hypothetical protein